jgi:hypothetical protein
MRWLAALIGAYLLATLFVGSLEVLLPTEGMGWLLVILFAIPLWLMGEAVGVLIFRLLIPVELQTKLGRTLSAVLLVLVTSVIFISSWLTVQYFKP